MVAADQGRESGGHVEAAPDAARLHDLVDLNRVGDALERTAFPKSRVTKIPGMSCRVASLMTTVPGSASLSRREATFSVSPRSWGSSPSEASTTTKPVCTPERTASSTSSSTTSDSLSCGLPAEGPHGSHGLLGVVLVSLRVAERHQQPVAQQLHHVASVALHHRTRGAVERLDDVTEHLSIDPARQLRGADQVSEHHRDIAALPGSLPTRCGRGVDGRPAAQAELGGVGQLGPAGRTGHGVIVDRGGRVS